MLLDDAELARRWAAHTPRTPENQTPWQEIYRSSVGQLADGGCLEIRGPSTPEELYYSGVGLTAAGESVDLRVTNESECACRARRETESTTRFG